MIIRICGFDEYYHTAILVPSTGELLSNHPSDQRLHDMPIISPALAEAEKQEQCRKCGEICSSDPADQMIHLKNIHVGKDMEAIDLKRRPLMHYFTPISPDDSNDRRNKTRECPNHFSSTNGPFACESFFPKCSFESDESKDGSEWKQMLDHLKEKHYGEIGAACVTCGYDDIITYKDAKTHVKGTKHDVIKERGQGPITKHEFLKRNDYRAPFLCNCDSRSSQNWFINKIGGGRFKLTQPKLEKDKKAKKARPRNRNNRSPSHFPGDWVGGHQPHQYNNGYDAGFFHNNQSVQLPQAGYQQQHDSYIPPEHANGW